MAQTWETSTNTATDFTLNVVARKSDEMLEPYERKRSRTVLRRERGSNSSDLVDYKFEGNMFVTTATEAALYDEVTSGLLRNRMGSLTHKNLPLAMFLEVGDLGYSAWGGSKTSAASNADIKSSLGLGIVRFTEQPEQPQISAYDYEYRVNTDVITAVRVSGGQSDPDNPTRVSFNVAAAKPPIAARGKIPVRK